MRERTRKIFVEGVLAYFDRVSSHFNVSQLNSDPRVFGALEVQNYLFAELSRPCLSVNSDSQMKICFVEYVAGGKQKSVRSNLSFAHATGTGSKSTIFPDLIFNQAWFLYKTDPLSTTYFPLMQQSINFYYRCKNLFVLRNLNEEPVNVSVHNDGCRVVDLCSSQQNGLENNQLTLESKGSAVLVLKRNAGIAVHKNDYPTVFKSSVGNVLVFYLATVLA